MTQSLFQDTLNRIIIYDATYAAGFALMLLLSVLRCNIYKISRARAAVYCLITFASGLAGAFLIGALYNVLFSLKGVETNIHVDMLGAVIFTAIMLPAAVSAEKQIIKRRDKTAAAPNKTVSLRDTMDLMTPGSFLLFACIKFGCFFRGCCFGVECSWGVYSPYLQTTVFPVQLFECVSICIILILCYYIKRTRFYRRGMTGPLAAWLYGLARFGWEFLRYYTPQMRVFAFGLTLWQLVCILVLIVAGIWLAVLIKTQPAQPMQKGFPPAGSAKSPKGQTQARKPAASKNGKPDATRAGQKKKKPAAEGGGKKHK